MNGKWPSPFRTPENIHGFGQWGQQKPYRVPVGPTGYDPSSNQGYGVRDDEEGDMTKYNGQNSNPWTRHPQLMQWLMGLFGNRR